MVECLDLRPDSVIARKNKTFTRLNAAFYSKPGGVLSHIKGHYREYPPLIQSLQLNEALQDKQGFAEYVEYLKKK